MRLKTIKRIQESAAVAVKAMAARGVRIQRSAVRYKPSAALGLSLIAESRFSLVIPEKSEIQNMLLAVS